MNYVGKGKVILFLLALGFIGLSFNFPFHGKSFCGDLPASGALAASNPLATVGEKKITPKEFKEELSRRASQFTTPDQKEALLKEMIRAEILYAAALKEGYDRHPEILRSLRQLLINAYRQEHLIPKLNQITVSDKEIEKYYRSG